MDGPKRRAGDHTFAGQLSSRIRHARGLAKLSQAALAKQLGVGPSAVAQWEIPRGTNPNVDHIVAVARICGVAFEWLATGRGNVGLTLPATAAIDTFYFAADEIEARVLLAFRRIPVRKRLAIVQWLENFF
jgi:transcriptional regulator with XRE-family HTH domain